MNRTSIEEESTGNTSPHNRMGKTKEQQKEDPTTCDESSTIPKEKLVNNTEELPTEPRNEEINWVFSYGRSTYSNKQYPTHTNTTHTPIDKPSIIDSNITNESHSQDSWTPTTLLPSFLNLNSPPLNLFPLSNHTNNHKYNFTAPLTDSIVYNSNKFNFNNYPFQNDHNQQKEASNPQFPSNTIPHQQPTQTLPNDSSQQPITETPVVPEGWTRMYRKLVEYHKQHKHCRVPRTNRDDKDMASLGNWVSQQRRKRKRDALSSQQIHLLNKLGFEWDRSYYLYFKKPTHSQYTGNPQESNNNNQINQETVGSSDQSGSDDNNGADEKQ